MTPVTPADLGRNANARLPEKYGAFSVPTSDSTPAVTWLNQEEMKARLPQPMQSNRQFNRLIKLQVLIPYRVTGIRGPVFDADESLGRLDKFIRKYRAVV